MYWVNKTACAISLAVQGFQKVRLFRFFFLENETNISCYLSRNAKISSAHPYIFKIYHLSSCLSHVLRKTLARVMSPAALNVVNVPGLQLSKSEVSNFFLNIEANSSHLTQLTQNAKINLRFPRLSMFCLYFICS